MHVFTGRRSLVLQRIFGVQMDKRTWLWSTSATCTCRLLEAGIGEWEPVPIYMAKLPNLLVPLASTTSRALASRRHKTTSKPEDTPVNRLRCGIMYCVAWVPHPTTEYVTSCT